MAFSKLEDVVAGMQEKAAEFVKTGVEITEIVEAHARDEGKSGRIPAGGC